MISEPIVDILVQAFGSRPWPAPLRRATGDRNALKLALESAQSQIDENRLGKTASILGSLLLGQAAEEVFEDLYSSRLATSAGQSGERFRDGRGAAFEALG